MAIDLNDDDKDASASDDMQRQPLWKDWALVAAPGRNRL